MLGNNRTDNVWSTIDPCTDVLGFTRLGRIWHLRRPQSHHVPVKPCSGSVRHCSSGISSNSKNGSGLSCCEIVLQRMSNSSVVKLAAYTPQVSTHIPPRLPLPSDNLMGDSARDVFILERSHLGGAKFHQNVGRRPARQTRTDARLTLAART